MHAHTRVFRGFKVEMVEVVFIQIYDPKGMHYQLGIMPHKMNVTSLNLPFFSGAKKSRYIYIVLEALLRT